MRAALVVALVALLTGTAAAQVPGTINFTARLVDDATGAEVTGSHRASFALFAAEAGGTALWVEDADVEVEEGLVFHDLGSVTAIDTAVFDGRRLFLEIAIDGERLEPRIALGSVPYAVRSTEATNAAMVGGIAADALQKRISGACGAGNFVIGVNSDGSVACGPDLSGTGDITEVLPGSGLQGGGASGSVTLSLVTCGINEVLKFNGTAWACAADANSGGDITSVSPGNGGGLTGGGASGDVALSIIPCANNQILRFTGASWSCSNDLDTNSGGTITGITTGSNSGLVGGVTSGTANLSLLTNCNTNQILKFNGTAWGCANDADTNSGGDITDVDGGAGLTVTNGGGPSVTVSVGQGQGIVVGADSVSLDLTFTDARYDGRYINATGDTMSGPLNMGGAQISNRGCPSGYVLHGPGLCVEDIDENNLTFTQCANKCRGQGNHICSTGELLSLIGLPVGNGGTQFDWADNMDSATTALFVSDPGGTSFASQAITLTAFCRCCASVE